MPAKQPVDDGVYQVIDGKWMDVGSFKRHVCCDCLLTHIVTYRIFEGRLQEKWMRDDKSTLKDRRRDRMASKRQVYAKRTSRRRPKV
jgi:hypothetical protein